MFSLKAIKDTLWVVQQLSENLIKDWISSVHHKCKDNLSY